MQRLVGGLFALLLAVCLPFGPASAQIEDLILIGGNYRLQGNLHNMQDGFFGAPSSADDDPMQRFVDTRLRLSFDLRPESPLSVHYGLEIGDVTFGARNPPIWDATGHRLVNVGSGSGGGEGADGLNLETKNAYLDLQVPGMPGLAFRGGILGWGDQFDWTILATDFTGLQFTYERQALWVQVTLLQFLEGRLRHDADDSRWLALDGRYDLSADTDMAAGVYLWDDNPNDNPCQRRRCVSDLRRAETDHAGFRARAAGSFRGLQRRAGIHGPVVPDWRGTAERAELPGVACPWRRRSAATFCCAPASTARPIGASWAACTSITHWANTGWA